MASSTSARWNDLGEAAPAASWRVRLLPDMAGIAGLVTFLYVLTFYQGHTRLFRDSDAGWHIRSGEEILRSGTLPRADPYSFSRTGEPWMNWEWLADVAGGAAHRAAGLAGVTAFYAAAIAVAVWLWFRLHWRLGTNFLLAAALAVPLLGTINLHWLARPHIFSWTLMLWAVWWLEGEPGRGRPVGSMVWWAAGSALWANLHGSFLFAPLAAGLYAAARLLRRSEWPAARYYGLAALVAGAATLLNPYGWNLHRHVIGYLSDARLLASVGEFQSFNFHVDGAGQILLALGVSAAGTLAALGRRRLDHFLLGVLLLGWSLRSARGLPLVALVLLPIAGAYLSGWWRERGLTALREYGERLGDLDRRASPWIWAPLLLAVAVASSRLPAGFPGHEFPVEAAARLEQLAPELFRGEGRLLAPDKFGGYLIYRFEGRLKVFLDGRSDFYGAAFLQEWRRLAQVRPGWGAILDKHRFTHALLPNDYSLVEALERAGWTVLHRDSTATLLALALPDTAQLRDRGARSQRAASTLVWTLGILPAASDLRSVEKQFRGPVRHYQSRARGPGAGEGARPTGQTFLIPSGGPQTHGDSLTVAAQHPRPA